MNTKSTFPKTWQICFKLHFLALSFCNLIRNPLCPSCQIRHSCILKHAARRVYHAYGTFNNFMIKQCRWTYAMNIHQSVSLKKCFMTILSNVKTQAINRIGLQAVIQIIQCDFTPFCSAITHLHDMYQPLCKCKQKAPLQTACCWYLPTIPLCTKYAVHILNELLK